MPLPKTVDRWWLLSLTLTLLVVPLGVALWSLRGLEWASLFDLALIEIRVREVGGAHTPLLGVPGRLGHDHLGSHPGPLAFYALAPIYRLFGSSILALRLSVVVLTTLAMAISLAVARRTAGKTGLLAVAASLSVLELGFGVYVLTQFWNPYLPVPWFVAFLVAVWATVAGKPLHLPLAAGCASLCAQAHVSYLATCAGPLAFAGLVVLVSTIRSRRAGVSTDGPRALALTVAVLGILWAPPLLQEWRNAPGNLATLLDFFLHPRTAPLGLRIGTLLVLQHLDPVHLLSTAFQSPGVLSSFLRPPFPSSALGGVSVGAWLTAAAFAHRLGNRPLLALHAIAGVSLVTALGAASRIIGGAYPYLMYSSWMVGITLLLAIVATAGVAGADALARRGNARSLRVRNGCGITLLLAITAVSVRLVATMTRPVLADDAGPATQLGSLARQTAAALVSGKGASTGRDGRYLVTWADALYGGGQGIGLTNELARHGFNVGVTEPNTILFGKHWALEERDATARVHFTNAAWLLPARNTEGAVMVAHVDTRTAAQRDEYMQLQELVAASLRKKGRPDVAERLPFDLRAGGDLLGYGTKEAAAFHRMQQIGLPAAVFVLPLTKSE